MQVNVTTAQIIIVACAVLHNVAIDSNDVLPEIEHYDPSNAADDEPHAPPLVPNNEFGIVRNELVANHFARLAGEE